MKRSAKHMSNFMALLIILAGSASGCRDPYLPPAITSPNHFLVVDGLVDLSADSSVIRLSRSNSLTDSAAIKTETNATVSLLDQTGNVVANFRDEHNGRYMLPHLNLSTTSKYQLAVKTKDGETAISDQVPVVATPDIDSIFWRKDGDVTIYLATHDPNNATKFYRWSFREDWEYDSYYNSLVGYDLNNRQLYNKTPDQMTTQCFRSNPSADILIASTAGLLQNQLDSQAVVTIPANTERLVTRYSIEVTQFGLTQEAFEYWQLLKKNASQLGTIFDPLPSSVTGNFHNKTYPENPVLGYFSVAQTSRRRIFIRNADVAPWSIPGQDKNCENPVITTEDSAAYYLYDPAKQPAYYITNLSGGPRGLAVVPVGCVDCRTRGGSTQKPAFW